MNELRSLPDLLVEPVIRNALLEDLGRAGDITTDRIVPADLVFSGRLVARRAGRIAGLSVAALAFRLLDARVTMHDQVADGQDAGAGQTLATVEGPARALLSGERVALNLLCHLSGIATETAHLAALIAGSKARVVCTRKTTPGLRALEKYAVAAGGGLNHRYGLDDAILIKDNHIAVAGGIPQAVGRVRDGLGHLVKVEVEVDTLAQLDEVLSLGGVDAVLLDNMPPAMLRQAVSVVAGRMITEASGGVTRDTIEAIAATGVDLISVGWITHSAPILDIGLDF